MMIPTKFLSMLLLGLVTLSACSKDEDEAAPSPSPAPTPAPTYPISGPASFALNAEGTSVLYQAGVSDYVNEQSDVTSSGSANYISNFVNSATNDNSASVTFFGQTFAGATPTDAEFYAFFEEGTRSYAILSANITGVSISFDSGSQNFWSLQVPQPSSSTFTITDSEPVDDGTGIAKVKIRATFNCRVVSTSTGASRTVTNGIFVGTFAKN